VEVEGALDVIPLWGLLPITISVVLLAVEIGYRLGRRRRQHSTAEKGAPVGAMVAATLGLLALMLAFSFGLAASRFDDHRRVVLDEANAIGTTYLRAAMLPEPIATETRNLLREYVDVRLEAVKSGSIEKAISKSAELHDRLWAEALAAVEKDRSPVTALFVESLNEVIDLHATRVMVGLRSRIPSVIWLALYVLAALAMSAMGYHEGLTSVRRSLVAFALVLSFAVVLFLIVDLDRPTRGLLQVSQDSMMDLRNSMSVPGSSQPTKDH
jgi:hypothetical protein